uniref:PAS domain-containing protein n=1 Tax=Roseivirga sp. TaxID=1964215 RepID=UPI0040480D6F
MGVLSCLLLLIYVAVKTKRQNQKLAHQLQELTQSRQAELMNLDLFLDHTSDFLYRYNLKGEIFYASPNIRRILGYDATSKPILFKEIQTDNPINNQVKQRLLGLLNPTFSKYWTLMDIPIFLKLLKNPTLGRMGSWKALLALRAISPTSTKRS